MKTTKAAFKRFAQEHGLQYHGSVTGPVERVIETCERVAIDPNIPRDPITVRSRDIVRHKPTGDSYLHLDGVQEVRKVGGYWLLITSWETNVQRYFNTVVYS